MELNMVCATWVKEDDEKVLKILEKSETWLSAKTLSEMTGIPLQRVQRTLEMLKRQQSLAEGRKNFLKN